MHRLFSPSIKYELAVALTVLGAGAWGSEHIRVIGNCVLLPRVRYRVLTFPCGTPCMSLNPPPFPALTLNKGLELVQGYPSAQGTTPMRARPGSLVVFRGQLDQSKRNSACPFAKAVCLGIQISLRKGC